jgi:hypothetical protein
MSGCVSCPARILAPATLPDALTGVGRDARDVAMRRVHCGQRARGHERTRAAPSLGVNRNRDASSVVRWTPTHTVTAVNTHAECTILRNDGAGHAALLLERHAQRTLPGPEGVSTFGPGCSSERRVSTPLLHLQRAVWAATPLHESASAQGLQHCVDHARVSSGSWVTRPSSHSQHPPRVPGGVGWASSTARNFLAPRGGSASVMLRRRWLVPNTA